MYARKDPRDPDEIYDAIVQALSGSPCGGPRIEREGLEYFSEECFALRVHEIVDTIALTSSDSGALIASQDFAGVTPPARRAWGKSGEFGV
jgi:hypothetical protein